MRSGKLKLPGCCHQGTQRAGDDSSHREPGRQDQGFDSSGRWIRAATTAAENARKVAEERLASHEAIKETALKIAAGHADTPPIYGPNGPANAAARAAESHLVDTEGNAIGTPEGITRKLRARLAGDPESGQLGAIHHTQVRIQRVQTQIRNAPALGLSSLQVAKLKHTHAEQKELLQKHSEILKRIDAGEISSIEAHGHLLAPDIDQIRSGRAQQISDEITSAARAARERTKIGHKKLSDAAAKEREQAKLSKSEPGYPGHDYHGKAPTSKNRGKQFEDNRLIVRLCSVLQSVPRSDLHELSAFIRDVEVRHLPSNVQENIRKFIKVKPGTRVAHYSMVADELVGKSDPHNLATAEVNVRKRLSQKAAATEVHNRRETKPILVMNDRVVDGHHFIGKAMHGKVSSSLHVLDLTPARFQMEKLQPAMIEL
jgi:hypothetical protein